MTINGLMRSLIEEIEKISLDISFVGTDGKEKKIKGYQQEIPLITARIGWGDGQQGVEGLPPETEEETFPYFIVQVDTVVYGEEESTAKVFILFAVHDTSQEMRGWQNITNMVERVVSRFRENTVLEYYYCTKQMTVAYPEQGEWPYFFAGLEMNWILPEMEEM